MVDLDKYLHFTILGLKSGDLYLEKTLNTSCTSPDCSDCSCRYPYNGHNCMFSYLLANTNYEEAITDFEIEHIVPILRQSYPEFII